METLLNKQMPAGEHTIEFNGSNLTTGVYFYGIIAEEYISVKKMLLR
ncbi:MAG: hypothetical protein K9J16_14080 [Melioribacteraceae bacterium]|nr:hypothetical protein [Melioribacteraceae bacterium]MCF8396196.1 hypothetical protein [Melioribacteraceae bacterium]MCF8420538.1 hypothetical protein [Melioribacteraceae bacterium]